MTRRHFTLAFLLALIVTIGLGVFLRPVLAQDSEAEQRGVFLRFVENRISTPDRQIRIGEIDGALSSDVRISEITIADKTGIWARITGVHLVWNRLALFSGRLSVDLLEAQSIEMLRRPVASGIDPAARGPIQVPVLPVAVQIGKLAVPRVALPADLVGQPAVLAIDGSIKLDSGALDAHLTIDRTDGAKGRLALAATYANEAKQLGLDLEFTEPQNGLLSNALGIEGRPALDFTVKGNGPLDNFAADITFSADGERLLAGRSTVSRIDQGFHLLTNLNGSIAKLVPAAYSDFVAGQSALAIDATRNDDGTIRLAKASVTSGVLALNLSGALGADGFPTAIDASGRIAGGTNGSVLLPGSSRIGSADFAIAFGGARPDWTAKFEIVDLQTASAGIRHATIEAGGATSDLADPKARSLTFAANGRVDGLTSKDPGVAKALGSLFTFSTKGDWHAGQPVRLAEASVANANMNAGFVGAYDENGLDGAYAIKAADLAPFSELAGRDLKGGIDLRATGNYFPVAGTFSLRLDGTADGLQVGQVMVDPLLRGTTKLSGILSRSEDGLHFTKVQVANSRVSAGIDGSFGKWDSDIAADLRLADLAAVTDRASGAASLTATLKGPNDNAALVAALEAPNLRLQSRTLRNGRLAFDGVLANGGVEGKASLSGTLDKVALTGSATLARGDNGARLLNDLVIRAGSTSLNGNLALATGGTFDGHVSVASPDVSVVASLLLLRASGALDADVELAAAAGKQNADVKATARNLKIETAAIGSADVNLQVADAVGTPAISGRIGASAITLSALSIPRLQASATPDGAATRVTYDADLVRPGLPQIKLTGTGRVQNRAALLDARLAGGGIDIRATGTVPFSGTGLDLTVKGGVPLTLVNPSLAVRGARVAGTINLDARIGGSFAAPDVRGTATANGASLSDPESGTTLSAIGLDASFDGTRATIRRFAANVGGGTIAANGTIGFAPGSDYPVNLTIALRRAKLSDGEIATAVVSGDLQVGGSLLGQPRLAGRIDAERVDVNLPEKLSARASFLDVRHRRPPPNLRRMLQKVEAAASPSVRKAGGISALTLDLSIRAPSRVYVRGRGVDAELGGTLQVRGNLGNIVPTGGFDLIRGRLDVVGQQITLSRGRVTLVGDLDPFIELTAESNRNSITVDVTVTGRVSDLQIQLSSSPDLPQDEILSQFLFGKSISDLSAFQIVSLTTAVAQLAGGGGNGNDLIGQIRKSSGLDQLDIVTQGNGSIGVRVGRAISDRVRVGVTAGSGGASGSIDLDITKDVKARAQAGSDVGQRAGESGGKVGIYYEKEY